MQRELPRPKASQCATGAKGELVHCGGPFQGCRSHSTSLQKACTTLKLHKFPPNSGLVLFAAHGMIEHRVQGDAGCCPRTNDVREKWDWRQLRQCKRPARWPPGRCFQTVSVGHVRHPPNNGLATTISGARGRRTHPAHCKGGVEGPRRAGPRCSSAAAAPTTVGPHSTCNNG